MQETSVNQKAWYSDYIKNLAWLGGVPSGASGREDLGAIAELRASARGGRFEIRALRHIVPYLSESSDAVLDRRVKIALIVGQVFAMCRMERPEGDIPDRGTSWRRPETIGRKLGFLDAQRSSRVDKTGPDEKRRTTATATERFLHTVVAADFDEIGTRLRNAAARIKGAGISMQYADYGQLLHDLEWWDDPEHRVQYRWVEEFYHARYRAENGTTSKEGDNNEE